MPKKRGLGYHVKHKSRLSLLLVLKIFFILFSFFIVMAVFSLLAPWSTLEIISLSQLVYWAVGLALVILLYLFFVIRIIKLFKFR